MVKISKLFFVVLFVVILSGCSADQAKPSDFWFEYKWTGPQVPAPEHFEYIIAVREDGKGSLSYYSDYMIETAKVDQIWKKEFVINEEEMNGLYKIMKSTNIFKPENMEEESVNFRDGYGTLWAHSDDTSYFVKIHNDSEPILLDLEREVKNVVPDIIWQEMENEHQKRLNSNPDFLDYELPELQY